MIVFRCRLPAKRLLPLMPRPRFASLPGDKIDCASKVLDAAVLASMAIAERMKFLLFMAVPMIGGHRPVY